MSFRAVVIPCALYPQYLPEALASVMQQRPRFDIVALVLDAKPDRTPEQRQEYREIFADLMGSAGETTVVVRSLHGNHAHGVSRVRNEGFVIVRNPWGGLGLPREAFQDSSDVWVTLLDEDDRLDVRYNERMARAQELAPDVDVWYPDWLEFGPTTHEPSHTSPEFSLAELKRGPFVPCGSTLRLSVWEGVRARNDEGFDATLTDRGLRWEDYLFFLEASLLGFRFERVGEALWWHREHGTTGTTIANLTVKQWREYARAKIERLYGVNDV